MKVKTMIMVAAMCFAIIPMIVFAVVSNIMIRNNGGTMYRSELKSMAQAQLSTMQAVMDKVQSDSKTLSAMPAVQTAAGGSSISAADDVLNRYMGDNAIINSISLVDAKGNIVSGTNKGKSYAHFDTYSGYDNDVLYFNSTTETGENNTMFIKTAVGDKTLYISYNLSGSNSLIGRFSAATSFYSNGAIYVIDPKGCWTQGSSVVTTLDSAFSADIVEKIPTLAENSVTDIIEFNSPANGDSACLLVNVGGANGLVAAVTCPLNRTGFYSSKSLTPIIVVAVLLSVASFVAALIVSKSVTKPLANMEETLVKIRRGDHEARISKIATNEYGQLSRAFNNVVDEIVVSEDRYKVISDMSDNIIFEWNFKTNEVTFSNNFNQKFSYRPPSDHFGDSFLMKAKIHPDDANRYRSDLDQLEKGKAFENNEYRIKNIYGDFIWILMRTATLNDPDGNPLKAVGVMVDIDRAKKSEAKLTEQASFDALTELYNRETIESQIDNEISLAKARQSEMAVMFIDVDDFKHYNDDYSHATGDQVLKFLAKTIKEAVDGIGFAGRYGGDEFIAMIRNLENNPPAEIAQKIIDKLAQGFDADVGERLTVSVSIGIAVIKDDYNTRVEYLIGQADDAMYSVKKGGKSGFAFI